MSTMSSRLALFLTANTAQATAALGRIPGSFMNIGRSAYQSSRQTSQWNQQMRALGTTIRYAFAGAALYGSMNMVRNLSQLQQQLGLISAIGTSGGFNLVGKNLDSMANQIFKASTDLITPTSDIADALTNLVSTVQSGQGLNRNDLVPAVEMIGRAAKLSQTPVEDMTRALTTMNVAFARPISLKNISDFAAKWYTLISSAPGGVSAAPQLAGQLGNIAGGARFAHVSPGQMFSMMLGTLRFGIVPQQAGQGLAYLLRTIATPEAPSTVKSAKEMFAQLGITNDFVQRQGGQAALFRIFGAAQKAGIHGNLQQAAKTAFAQVQAGGQQDEGSIAGLGLTGAGINVLATAFRRQHALRTAIALYSMWASGQFQRDLGSLGDSMSAVQKQQKEFADAWARFVKQAGLAQAATAVQNLTLQFSKNLAPVLNLATRPLVGLEHAAARHPGVTQDVSYGVAALLAALGLNKLAGGRIFGAFKNVPILKNIFGAGSQAALMTKAAEDAAKGVGNLTPGLSPEHPLYVVVVGQLLKSPGTTSGNLSGGGSPAGKIEDIAKKTAPGGLTGLLARFGGWRMVGRLGAAGLAGYGLAELQKFLFGGGHPSLQKGMVNLQGGKLVFDPKTKAWFKGDHTGLMQFLPGDTRREQEISAAKALHTTFQNIKKLEAAFQSPDVGKVLKDNNDRLVAAITGSPGQFTLDLTIVQDGKPTVTKRVHIDPSEFQGGKSASGRGRKSKVLKKTITTRHH